MSVLRRWTIGRATGAGVIAAASTLIFWPLFDSYRGPWLWPLLLALTMTGLSGGSILFITAVDLIMHRRRSRKLRPLRVFDLMLGSLLIALTLFAVQMLAGQLPVEMISR